MGLCVADQRGDVVWFKQGIREGPRTGKASGSRLADVTPRQGGKWDIRQLSDSGGRKRDLLEMLVESVHRALWRNDGARRRCDRDETR